MDIKEVFLLWFINFLIPKTSGSGDNNKIKQNEQLAKELRKPIIKRFEKEEFIL